MGLRQPGHGRCVCTPEVLADYARSFQAGPGWLFLTGDEADITLLRKKLSLYRPEIQNETNDHNLSLIIKEGESLGDLYFRSSDVKGKGGGNAPRVTST